MRLQCDVELVNRMLPSLGMRSKGRSSRAILSIGKPNHNAGAGNKSVPNSSGLYLLICTCKDRTGSKYKLKENVEQLFTLFVEEGKATVRLKEPAVDIRLSKQFLTVARLAHRGSDPIGITPLVPVATRHLDAARTRMSILKRKDYPESGFPSALEQLTISTCGLIRIDPRILSLRALRRLDLSHNRISSVPEALGSLRLTELVLSSNCLCSFSDKLCRSNLRDTLTLLDLSQNQLTRLPPRLAQLHRLHTLRLDQNQLEALPGQLGRLSRLRCLSAGQNQLSALPNGFSQLRLDTLDLHGNPFKSQSDPPLLQISLPLTLLELSARAVLDHRLEFSPALVPWHLCEDLEFSGVCVCGRACLFSFVRCIVSINLHNVSHTVVLLDSLAGTEAPIHALFCSLACYYDHLDQSVQRRLR
ncbi:hypothetical protein DNTS_030454 [Danionella cerebrum]|uniref:Leucine-rich repeat protein 1 n=1 Tax=Danionella cerebrum TaxID=2873325 RepID=A0A553MLW4_9TELE|nr:hypothetical protein DNTS_030454 [Danionella translucida]